MQTWKVSFNSLTSTLFHSSFVRKNVFYIQHIQYAYNFYGTNMYVNVYRSVFRTKLNICGGVSLRKLQESFIVDVWLGSKYATGIGFTAERVHHVHQFLQHEKVNEQSLIYYQVFCCCCEVKYI